MPEGDKLTTKEKSLFAKFSLLNIETILKGISNTESNNASAIRKSMIDLKDSFNGRVNKMDIGIAISVTSAM